MMVRLKRAEHVMGTVVSFDVDGTFGAAVDDAVRWLHWVDATFSTFRVDSEVSRLGRGLIAASQCSPAVREVLAACDALSARTGGYFSATAGGSLDPSGYVKGWAVERAAAMLTSAGSPSHCVNGGGDVRCTGPSPRGDGWRIGVADRGRHVLDPHTGQPAEGLLSVTVTGPDLALADAYATAVFAMGLPRAYRWRAPGYEVFGITADGGTWRTPGFPVAPAPRR
jgi:thiamine biosynthesis lipoprotein